MDIGIIQPRVSYYVGGGEKVPTRHIEYLCRKGHKVTLYTLKPGNKGTFLYQSLVSKNISNLKIYEYPSTEKLEILHKIEPGQDRFRWDAESICFNNVILNDLADNNHDLILSYYLLDSLVTPSKSKTVLYLLGYTENIPEIYKALFYKYDATISISNNVKDNWNQTLDHVQNNFVLGVGVDGPKWSKKNNVKKSTIDITFAGRLIERKGIEDLLESFKTVRKRVHNARLNILGEGPLRSKLELFIKRNGLQDSVEMQGMVENVDDYYTKTDICVFPSKSKEGLMGVVLEAMSYGIPVISTTKNGNEDVIDETRGVLIEPGDVDSLTEQIIRLCQNPELCKRIGENAKEYFEKNLRWESNVTKLESLLEQIAKC